MSVKFGVGELRDHQSKRVVRRVQIVRTDTTLKEEEDGGFGKVNVLTTK